MNDRRRPSHHRDYEGNYPFDGHQQHDDEEELQAELDSLVIEAIENIVDTSRRLRNVQKRRTHTSQRHREPPQRRQPERPDPASKITHLHTKRTGQPGADDAYEMDTEYSGDYDEDTCQLPGLSSKQRERAERFAEWLMQQDNYPIILQHVEELLSNFSDDDEWNEQSQVDWTTFEEDDLPQHEPANAGNEPNRLSTDMPPDTFPSYEEDQPPVILAPSQQAPSNETARPSPSQKTAPDEKIRPVKRSRSKNAGDPKPQDPPEQLEPPVE